MDIGLTKKVAEGFDNFVEGDNRGRPVGENLIGLLKLLIVETLVHKMERTLAVLRYR